MARAVFSAAVRRASSVLKSSPSKPHSLRSGFPTQEPIFIATKHLPLPNPLNASWVFRNLSHGSVNLVISQGKPKFEMHEIDPPKKEKWLTKKRLKQQRMREKQERRAANRKDPRRLGIKRKKKGQKFANAEERIKYKLEKARIKEALLIERLKRYEIPKVQGPEVQPDDLTGEERFYMKKMAQKKSNYAPIGKRGIFGGVILNMHMHWKKHETVKVICKPCKPGQVHEYAQEIARLSGGIPIQIVGDDTIIFYRGKNYVMPKVMSPTNTLSKKKALEKFKYEQSLETVRHFIAVAEKELELYYRHIALYGDPNDRNPISILDSPTQEIKESGELKMLEKQNVDSTNDFFSASLSEINAGSSISELSESEDSEDDKFSINESDSEDDNLSINKSDSEDDSIFDSANETISSKRKNSTSPLDVRYERTEP
ncbi:CRM domain-containing protein [Pyrus ussuriensis x Pyrus communis]|uniref:CRM domain-containing protein n=1 Tax=Pyrus ussuriensis x Pyrus communis TaxID=2448454 RepID=A0A5N5H4M8_9ROSA|nr:CRM domain-containing protein [Pyrus ussuriensis x Pyrus communis]